jgi:hypothetical protein
VVEVRIRPLPTSKYAVRTFYGAGRRQTMTVAGQSQICYGWDNANRLTGISRGSYIRFYWVRQREPQNEHDAAQRYRRGVHL